MGGGAFQVSDARQRVARREKPAGLTPSRAAEPTEQQPTPLDLSGAVEDGLGLPAAVAESSDLAAAIAGYLTPIKATPAPSASGKATAAPADASSDWHVPAQRALDPRDLAVRLTRLRITAAELGKAGDFDRAADLISAAIACRHAEPWMYEALAVAMEAAGRPAQDVERALLSSADFATTPADLLSLASYLARFGATKQAIRICRQVTLLDPSNREACALAMSLAARSDNLAALRWACAGVLSHEWPTHQQEVATRAARLAKAAITRLNQEENGQDAAAFQSSIDEALVRDIQMELSWNGDADIDLIVEEPSGTVCSLSSPRSTSGGMLLADQNAAGNQAAATQRERYVAAEAFPGAYRMLVRRASGNVAAGMITAELTLHRGTDREQKLRRQLPLGADEMLLNVELVEGRRREPLADAQVAQDVVVQQNLGRAILAQQLAGLADPAAAASLSQSRNARSGQQMPGLPFFRSGAVGYQPVVTQLPEGTNLFARAVVSADRRYVRVTATPLFSGVGQVTQFNSSGGGAAAAGAAGAGGAGAGGAGAGGAGAGGAGAGGGGIGAGAAGGAGGAGAGAAGGAGGVGGAF